MARVFKYERVHNARCPAQDFLDEIEKPMRVRFAGQCDALTKQGAQYCNRERFCPLHRNGKPLWEFKEHAHRLYCFRKETKTGRVIIVLFNGWTKSKKGKRGIENREIAKAIDLFKEFSDEYPEEEHELLGNKQH
jgi:hypothetical protein